MNKDDGGPAFPAMGGCDAVPCMRLRDWFAGQALTTTGTLIEWMFSHCNEVEIEGAKDGMLRSSHIANIAYEIADAMLAEREKGE